MIKTLAKSIREYKKATILTPLFISLEVLIECMIPLITATFVNVIELKEITAEAMKSAANPLTSIVFRIIGEGTIDAQKQLKIIIAFGIVLVILAAISLAVSIICSSFTSSGLTTMRISSASMGRS